MAKILLVEDEVLISLGISIVLEDAGHSVDLAYDGVGGLRAAQEARFDLIITDFMMPKMNGDELIVNLRKIGYDGPILLATSIHESHLPQIDGRRHDEFLQKPYRDQALVEKVQKLLSSQKPEG